MPSAEKILLEATGIRVELPTETGPVPVLDGVALALHGGEIVDISGPSGSGKSTFLRVLSRLMPLRAGALELRGLSSEQIPAQAWRARVALLPQRPSLICGNIAENLSLPWRFKVRDGQGVPSAEKMRTALDELRLEEVSLDRDVSRLSVGQQARLAFARLWLTSPEVLLLDEAEASLDEESVRAMSKAIADFAALDSEDCPRAVLRVSHRASDGLANRKMLLTRGRLEEVEL